jgi:ankyrin repeat protein
MEDNTPELKLNHIYPSGFYEQSLDRETSSEIFKVCLDGEVEKVRSLVNDNVNIYQYLMPNYKITPLFVTLPNKHEEIANLLLDVYECDLEALSQTNFTRALIALPEDQTEEFYKTIELEADGDNSLPVLIKLNNRETPKCVFLRRTLKSRDDSSVKIARQLEEKNGLCDLNSGTGDEDSFLHLAIAYDLKTTTEKLLKNPKTNKTIANRYDHTPLHYAIFAGNLQVVERILSNYHENVFVDDSSYLYQAAVSGKEKLFDFVVDKLMENGKSFKDILKTSFTFNSYFYDNFTETLLHVLVKNANFIRFIQKHQEDLDEDVLSIKNSKGNTILHEIVQTWSQNAKEKTNLVEKIVEKFPKLLLVENNDRQLPVHLAAKSDIPRQRFFRLLLQMTVKESGNPEIFYSNDEVVLEVFMEAIRLNNGLSKELWNSFKGVLKAHGPQFLQKTISIDKKVKTLTGILSANVKVDPNEYFDGRNAFHALLSYELKFYYGIPPANNEMMVRLKALMEHQPIADINARDATGTTIFMFIVGFCRDNDFIESLVASGADCTAVNNVGSTCLHYAMMNVNNKEVVGILLKNNADASKSSPEFGLPIHFGTLLGNEYAVDALIGDQSLTDDKIAGKFTKFNRTLIQTCMSSYNKQIIQKVIDLHKTRSIELDVNQLDDNGNTLAMINLENQEGEIIGFLLDNFKDQIDFGIRNNQNETFISKLTKQVYFTRKFIDWHPVLKESLNAELKAGGEILMENLLTTLDYESLADEIYLNFLVGTIDQENLTSNFHKFSRNVDLIQRIFEKYPTILDDLSTELWFKIIENFSENLEKFELVFAKLPASANDLKSSNDRNFLHVVCEKNNFEVIYNFINRLSVKKVEELSKDIDKDKQKPFDLLNDDNKLIFKSVFNPNS